jgi:hypothetical protein
MFAAGVRLVAATALFVSAATVAETIPSSDDDSSALSLSGVTAPTSGVRSALSLTTEAALTEAEQQSGGAEGEQRLSFDLRYDAGLTPTWRVVFADRLDLDWTSSPGRSQQINTIKDGYLSWQPQTNLLLDAGRINVRQGVAFGYNPTDFLRFGALRTIDSLDPNSLRDDRQGAVMVRGETLWSSGALTALYSPRLDDHPSTAPFNPDFGATNAAGRWLLSVGQQVAPGWNPQLLLFGTDGSSPQVGTNLTTVLGTSTVAYIEASGGHGASLWTQALDAPLQTSPPAAPQTLYEMLSPDSPRVRASFQTRAATGITYSTAYKLSLTFEYEYDSAALSRADWSAARAGDPLAYARYREFVSTQQELPTQHAFFAYASWQDLLVQHLDLAAFVRVDLVDGSRLPWTELRYHWPRIDVSLRWQDYQGGKTSDFGASPSRQTWQVLLDYYL